MQMTREANVGFVIIGHYLAEFLAGHTLVDNRLSENHDPEGNRGIQYLCERPQVRY